MTALLRREGRARPVWVLALAVVLALHCVCIVCLAAAASAAEQSAAGAAPVTAAAAAEVPAVPPSSEGTAGGDAPLATGAAHDCDAALLMAAVLSHPGSDSGATPGLDRSAGAALALMFLFAAGLAVALWAPPPPFRVAGTRVSAPTWRPAGVRLLTSLCILRI